MTRLSVEGLVWVLHVQIDTNRALTPLLPSLATELSAYVSRIERNSEHVAKANRHPEAEHLRPLLRWRPEVRNTTVAPGLTRKTDSDSIRYCARMAAISIQKRSGLSPRTTPTVSSSTSAGPTTVAIRIARAADAWSHITSGGDASDARSRNAAPSSR